jgi:plastocyanin
MSSRFRIGLIVLSLALVAGSLSAVACGSSKKSATPTPGKTTAPAATPTPGMTMAPAATPTTSTAATATPAATTGTAPKMVSATIKDFEFGPATVTVAVGGTVTWTNNGPSTHTVTADDGTFDSGNLSTGKTFSQTFDTAGTFPYHCSIHPFMKATVIVQ